jgi:hypothetical protein
MTDSRIKNLTHAKMVTMGQQLAEQWISGNTAAVHNRLKTVPRRMALALAVHCAKSLDEVFNEGADFRHALFERATHA